MAFEFLKDLLLGRVDPTLTPTDEFFDAEESSGADTPTPRASTPFRPLGSALDALGRPTEPADVERPVPSRAATAASFVSAVGSPPPSRAGTASTDLSDFAFPHGDTPSPATIPSAQPAVARASSRGISAAELRTFELGFSRMRADADILDGTFSPGPDDDLRRGLDGQEMGGASPVAPWEAIPEVDEPLDVPVLDEELNETGTGSNVTVIALSPPVQPDLVEGEAAQIQLGDVVREAEPPTAGGILAAIGSTLGSLVLSVPGVRSAFSLFTRTAIQEQPQAPVQVEEAATPLPDDEDLIGATAPYLDAADDADFVDPENVAHVTPPPALTPIEVVVHAGDVTPPPAVNPAQEQARDESPVDDPFGDLFGALLGRGDPTLTPTPIDEFDGEEAPRQLPFPAQAAAVFQPIAVAPGTPTPPPSPRNDTPIRAAGDDVAAEQPRDATPAALPVVEPAARGPQLAVRAAPGSPDGDDSSDDEQDAPAPPPPPRDATPIPDAEIPAAQPRAANPVVQPVVEPELDPAGLQMVLYDPAVLAGRARVEHAGRDEVRDAQADRDIVRPNDGAALLEALRHTYAGRAAGAARAFVEGYFPTWLGGRAALNQPVGVAPGPQAPTYLGVAAAALDVTRQTLTLVNHVLTRPDEVAAAVGTVRTALGIPAQDPAAVIPAAAAQAPQEPSALTIAGRLLPLVDLGVRGVTAFVANPQEFAQTAGRSIREASTAFQAAVTNTPPALADGPLAEGPAVPVGAAPAITLTSALQDPTGTGRQIGTAARNFGQAVVDSVLGRDPAVVADAEVPADAPPAITLTSALQDPAGTGRQIGTAARNFGQAVVDSVLGRDPAVVADAEVPADAPPAITLTSALQDPAGTGRQIGTAARNFGQAVVDGVLGRDPAAAPAVVADAEVPADAPPGITVTGALQDPAGTGRQIGTAVRDLGLGIVNAALGRDPAAPAVVADAEVPADAPPAITLTSALQDPAGTGRQIGTAARNFGQAVVDGVLGRDPAAAPAVVADAEVPADAPPGITVTGALQDPAGTGRQIGTAVRDLGLGIVNAALGRDPAAPAVVADAEVPADAPPAITLTSALQDPAGTGRQIGTAVRTLGQGIVDSVLGRDPAAPADAPAADAASPSMLGGFLSQMSTWVRDGVRKQTMNMLLGGLSLVLAQAATDIADPALAAQLNEMIAEIDRVKAGNGNFETLRTNLTRIMNGQDASGAQVRSILQLHFNGWFQLPLRAEEEAAVSSKTILAANIAAIPEEAALPPVDYKRGIPVVQDRIVKNISAMSSMQVANQFMCKGLISDAKLSEILGSCPRDDNYLTNVRNKFFEEINKLDIAWYKKLGAKITFRLISLTSNHYLKRFLTSLLEKIETAAKPGSSVEIQAQHTAIVQRTNDYLAILKGTIKRVHEDPAPTANHVAMIEKELAQPKFNHGYTKERLYSEATSKAIYEILPPLGWTQNYNEATAKMPSALQWALLPLTFPVRMIVFVSEALGNAIVRSIIHTVITRSNVLETVIDKSVGQVYRNGYTHSINKIILDQLKHMWKALEEDSSPTTDPKATVANKEELRQLVVNLYDVLELNRRARHADSEPTFLEKAKSAVYKMSTDYSADVIALIIDKAKNIFLQPDLIPMREYTLLEALNSALESTEIATEDEMVKLEQDIMELSDAILYRATKTVVHDSFTSAPTQMQKLFQKFTDQLKGETAQFVAKVRLHVGTTNTNAMLGEIKKYNEDVLNLQKLVEADPYVSSEAALFDRFYTRPLAEILARLSTSIREGQPADNQTRILQEIEALLPHMPEVKHVNSAVLPINDLAERAASKIAFRAGKEFFDEAWRALRTPYNWRYGAVHHGVIIPFVESK